MKRLAIIALLGLGGCGLFTSAQQQQVGQQVVQTGLQQATCFQTQLLSTMQAAQAATKTAATPSGTELAAWSEQAASYCALKYPLVIAIPSAVATPAQ